MNVSLAVRRLAYTYCARRASLALDQCLQPAFPAPPHRYPSCPPSWAEYKSRDAVCGRCMWCCLQVLSLAMLWRAVGVGTASEVAAWQRHMLIASRKASASGDQQHFTHYLPKLATIERWTILTIESFQDPTHRSLLSSRIVCRRQRPFEQYICVPGQKGPLHMQRCRPHSSIRTSPRYPSAPNQSPLCPSQDPKSSPMPSSTHQTSPRSSATQKHTSAHYSTWPHHLSHHLDQQTQAPT